MQGLRPLYRYFDFSGRSGRAEFWQFTGLCCLGLVVTVVIDVALGSVTIPLLTILLCGFLAIPYYAVLTRRLHDNDMNGWPVAIYAGVAAVSLILPYQAAGYDYSAEGDLLASINKLLDYALLGINGLFFVFCIRRGTVGPNRFGLDPADTDGPAPTFGDVAKRVREQAHSTYTPPQHPNPYPAAAPTPHARPAPPQPASGVADADPLTQIERLAKLREAGMLTDEEFQAQKASLLSRL